MDTKILEQLQETFSEKLEAVQLGLEASLPTIYLTITKHCKLGLQ